MKAERKAIQAVQKHNPEIANLHQMMAKDTYEQPFHARYKVREARIAQRGETGVDNRKRVRLDSFQKSVVQRTIGFEEGGQRCLIIHVVVAVAALFELFALPPRVLIVVVGQSVVGERTVIRVI